MHLQAEAAGGRRLALHLDPAIFIAGETQATVTLPAGRIARLCFDLLIKLHRIAQQARDVGVCAQLADKAGRVPGGAGSELMPLEQQDLHTALRQMIGDRAADDPAADHDDFCALRQFGHVLSISSNAVKAASKRRRFSSV